MEIVKPEHDKADNEIDMVDKGLLWLQLLKAETEEDLVKLEETEVPEIKKACAILRELSADEEFVEKVRMREKELRDEAL